MSSSPSKCSEEWSLSLDNPRNWSDGQKWAATATACLMSCLVSVTASAYSQAVDEIASDFDVPELLAVGGISTFTIAVGVFPLFMAPLCEKYGRQRIYLASYALFFLFFLPIALARNITTVLVARFISGAAGSVGTTIVGGTLSDLWTKEQRAVPMSLFALSALLGTPIGVVSFSWAGGPRVSWRWIFWTLLLLAVPSAACILLFFRRETFPLEARRQANSLTQAYASASMRKRVVQSAFRPLYLLVTEPIALALSLWISFAWGTLYLFLESVPLVFAPYGFTHVNMTRGLSFVGAAIGSLLGFAVHMFVLRVRRQRSTTISEPEERLPEACIGAFVFASGFFIFAWTAMPERHIHWIVPQIGTSLILMGMFMVYICIFDFLTDCYGAFSSSAIAAQSFLRNIFATGTSFTFDVVHRAYALPLTTPSDSIAFPLVAQRMYVKLTYRWASSLLGFIAFALAFIPIALICKGKTLRTRSAFAVSGIGEV